jgi:hypothetical protein
MPKVVVSSTLLEAWQLERETSVALFCRRCRHVIGRVRLLADTPVPIEVELGCKPCGARNLFKLSNGD